MADHSTPKHQKYLSLLIFWLAIAVLLICTFCGKSSAQDVAVTAKLTDGTGTLLPSAFLHFELYNCGDNFPTVNGQPLTIVRTNFDMKPDPTTGKIAGNIFGNNEIFCGNVASTQWIVTPMKDQFTAFSQSQYYFLSGPGTFDPSVNQPVSFTPPTPGLQVIFANPTTNQTLVQPPGTSLSFFGVIDFTHATVIGLPAGVGNISCGVSSPELCNTGLAVFNGTNSIANSGINFNGGSNAWVFPQQIEVQGHGLFDTFTDFVQGTGFGLPASGNARVWFDSTTGLLSCITSGNVNCMPSGGGGGLTGSGTSGTIPIWTGTTALGNSLLTNVTGPPAGINYSLGGGESWQVDSSGIKFNTGVQGSSNIIIANTFAPASSNNAGGVVVEGAPATGSACAGSAELLGGSTSGGTDNNGSSVIATGGCANGFGATGSDIDITAGSTSHSNGGGNVRISPGTGNFGNGSIFLGGNSAQAPVLFAAGASKFVTVQAPSALTGNWTFNLPKNPGTNGQFLQTDGTGVTSWANSGGAPGTGGVIASNEQSSCTLALNNGEWNCSGSFSWGSTLTTAAYEVACSLSYPDSGHILPAGYDAHAFWTTKTVTGFTYTINDDHSGANGATYTMDCSAFVGSGGVVMSLTGDGTIFTNSSSTGNVTLALASQSAHTLFGNPGATSSTPSFFGVTAPLVFAAGALTCQNCALTTSPLNQFASTTSAQLATVISDELGSGALAFSTNSIFSGLTSIAQEKITGITGAVQCLHVDVTGLITGTGVDCGAGGGGGSGPTGPNFAQSFTSVSSITILGTQHNYNTKNLLLQCYDNATPANAIQPASWTIDPSTFNVVVNFATTQSGYCSLNGSGPAVFTATESSSTSWTVAAATHGLGTSLQIQTYDPSGNRVDPDTVNVDGSGNVTISWAIPQAGKLVLTQ